MKENLGDKICRSEVYGTALAFSWGFRDNRTQEEDIMVKRKLTAQEKLQLVIESFRGDVSISELGTPGRYLAYPT
jgi:hypothetical protein